MDFSTKSNLHMNVGSVVNKFAFVDQVNTRLLVVVVWNIPFGQSSFTLSILCGS